MSEPIEEGSTCTFRVDFFDASGDPVTPSAARYRIKDLTNDRVVRDWTDVVPAASIDIAVIASDNNIYRKARRRIEERSLVVQANHGTDSQYVREELYRIRNQRGWQSDES
jgi:hypothetical protein